MKVEFRLHGYLTRYISCASLALDLPEDSTVEEALNRLGLPERYGFAVFVNLEQHSLTTPLKPRDCVDLVPAEQGG